MQVLRNGKVSQGAPRADAQIAFSKRSEVPGRIGDVSHCVVGIVWARRDLIGKKDGHIVKPERAAHPVHRRANAFGQRMDARNERGVVRDRRVARTDGCAGQPRRRATELSRW